MAVSPAIWPAGALPFWDGGRGWMRGVGKWGWGVGIGVRGFGVECGEEFYGRSVMPELAVRAHSWKSPNGTFLVL